MAAKKAYQAMQMSKSGRGWRANSTEKASSNQMPGVPRRYRLKPRATVNKRAESTHVEKIHDTSWCQRGESVSFALVSLKALPSTACCSILLALALFLLYSCLFLSLFPAPLASISKHLTEGAGNYRGLCSRCSSTVPWQMVHTELCIGVASAGKLI